jgi:hypothetical protein
MSGDIYAETINIGTFGGVPTPCSVKINPILGNSISMNLYATDFITIQPNVHLMSGSSFSASIIPLPPVPIFIDCSQKFTQIQVEQRDVKVPDITNTDMSIYPNPTNGTINIEYQLQLNEPQLLNLYLYDITGRLVKVLIDSEQHFSGRYYKVFDESSLPQGIYFYQLQVGSQKIIKKVVRM